MQNFTQEQVLQNLKNAGYGTGTVESARAAITSKEATTRSSANNIKNMGTTTDTSGITSSSSKNRAEETQIKSDLDRTSPVSADEARIKATYTADIKAIDDYLKQLESQNKGNQAGINAQFDETKRQTEFSQTQEKGTTTVGLARIGGYLGNSASSIGAMVNLGVTHKNEILSLENKRASAIQAANDAYNKNRFELVRLKLNEAKEMEKSIMERKDKFFEQTLELSNARMREDEFFREKYKDELTALGTATLSNDEIDPKKMKEIDDFYGVQGFTKNYLDVARSTAKANSEKEQLAINQKMLTLLQDIPSGQTVAFPDGTQYTGIGKTSDISTFQETDANGVVRMFTYNKGSGELTSQSLGVVGKPSSAGADTNNTRVTEVISKLEELIDPATGHVTVEAYNDMYKEYAKQNNGKGQEFFNNLDPLVWTGRLQNNLRMNIPSTDDDDGVE